MKRPIKILTALFAAVGVLAVVMIVQPAALWAAPVMVPALPSTEVQVHRLSSVNELKAALESGGRLFTIGNPADVDDYVQAVRRTPNLVLVVVERSADHSADAEILVQALQNSGPIRRGIVDHFTNIPNGLAAVRFDLIEDGQGRMDFYAALRLDQVGFTQKSIATRYRQFRCPQPENRCKGGLSVAESLAQVVAEANAAVDADNAATIAYAQKVVVDGRQAIQDLSSLIAESGLMPVGYSDSMPAEWSRRLSDAESQLNRATSLDSVNQSTAAAQAVVAEVGRFQQLVDQELRGRVLQLLALRGFLGLVVLATVLSAVLTAYLRREAMRAIEAKEGFVDEKLQLVTALEGELPYLALASGKQAQEAKAFAEFVLQLLSQVLAFQKFETAAERVFSAKGLASVYYHLLPFGVWHVRRLLEGKATLTVTREEVRLFLKPGTSLDESVEALELSLDEVISSIKHGLPRAEDWLKRLKEADATLVSGIEELEAKSKALEAVAAALPNVQGLFSGEPVLEILPSVTHPESGLIARAKQALEANNAIGGIEDYLIPARRILAEGEEALRILRLGAESERGVIRETKEQLSVPQSGIAIEWVTVFSQDLSERLSSVIQRLPYESIAQALAAEEQALHSFVTDLGDAKRVNELRLSSWPEVLDATSARVTQVRGVVLRELQALRFFSSGKSEELLQEPGANAELLVGKIERAIHEVVTVLSSGALERVREIEDQVAESFRQMEWLLAQSERRARECGDASARISGAVDQLTEQGAQTASAIRVAARDYSAHSQREACLRVSGQSETLMDGLQRANATTDVAREGFDRARREMDRGFVLAAGVALDEAQKFAEEAEHALQSLIAAIDLLRDKVAESAGELSEVSGLCEELARRARQSGVRTATKHRLEGVSTSIATIEQSVSSAPYEALRSLAENRTQLEQIDRAIENDLRLAREIAEKLSEAEALQAEAELALTQARARSFSNATVDLGHAERALRDYCSACSSLTGYVAQEDYESALTAAQRAFSEVSSVGQLATDAVSAAERDQQAHDDSVTSYRSYESTGDSNSFAGFTTVSDPEPAASYESVPD